MVGAKKEGTEWEIFRMIFIKQTDGDQPPEIVDIMNDTANETAKEPSNESLGHGEAV